MDDQHRGDPIALNKKQQRGANVQRIYATYRITLRQSAR
jgi:hypothetical protein